jgi:cell division protein FtsA
VIEPRVEEIFSLVHQVMRESGYEEVLSSASCSPAAAR